MTRESCIPRTTLNIPPPAPVVVSYNDPLKEAISLALLRALPELTAAQIEQASLVATVVCKRRQALDGEAR